MQLKDIVKSISKNSSNGQISLHPSKREMKKHGLTEDDILNSTVIKRLNKLGKTNAQ